MSDEILNSLLKEYDMKKLKAEQESENRKEYLYNKFPRLEKIEKELNTFAINKAKNILKNGNNLDFQHEIERKIYSLRQEKNDLLRELNISSDFLTPHYECSICNDTGYITVDNYKTIMCNCLKQRLLNYSFNKSNMSNLDKENFSTFNPNLFSEEVDVAKYKFNISPRKNILNIKDKCLEFVENFNDANYKNLLFVGNTGLR